MNEFRIALAQGLGESMPRSSTRYRMEVRPSVPDKLARLSELADDLWYSWDRPTRRLFARLDPGLWLAVGHSPKALLREVHQSKLEAAADDPSYLSSYRRVLSAYDSYLAQGARRVNGDSLAADDLIAYFCAEFGFHESLPIYSGGLGILAGDHCKAASDARLPFVGVGLLYRQGYFFQTIAGDGSQNALYEDSDFDALPIEPALDPQGREVVLTLDLIDHPLTVKVWQAKVGHIRLYLLDTDRPENSDRDRHIAHRLYGGDSITRIEQELVLGVGGVRALAALGLKPTVWHINEGHAAFQAIERTRVLMQQGLDFAAAVEGVAAATVFTTHTAVPAGHDHFADDVVRRYFERYCRDAGIETEQLVALGHSPRANDFNMTTLALRTSRHHNGVSRIHESVSDEMLADLWPQIEPHENPIGHVTNGVHVLTFLASEWCDIFDRFLGVDWTQRLTDVEFWQRVERIPDPMFWSVREYLKTQMLKLVRERVQTQLVRNHGSESHLDRLFRFADPAQPKVLTIGFGRRFATYKRSTLLFQDLDVLRQIVCNPERPVLFLFAGKAHPADQPGQDLIRRIMQVAKMPEFVGHILLIEGYDLRLARRMVGGVDVWLNNPIHPLEASGTSGMKAAMNGAINLSVADGWWDEAYDGTNGWAIKPASDRLDAVGRDRDEADTLYELLQDHVIPQYYARDGLAYSPRWVQMAKSSMATVLPRFNTERMLGEYLRKFYRPAAQRSRLYTADGGAGAKDVARWKERARAAWPQVNIERCDTPAAKIAFGEHLTVEVSLALAGLSADDVAVELLLQDARGQGGQKTLRFAPAAKPGDGGRQHYTLDLAPELCGKLDYRIRAYPTHPLLTHPFETGLMLWL
jgi:starch phosphorylase